MCRVQVAVRWWFGPMCWSLSRIWQAHVIIQNPLDGLEHSLMLRDDGRDVFYNSCSRGMFGRDVFTVHWDWIFGRDVFNSSNFSRKEVRLE